MSRARDKANSVVSNFASTGIDDNADANAITIDSSENVGISNAIPGSFNAGANNLVVGSGSGSEGITIYGGAESNIFFADGTATADNLRGRIEYSHGSDSMSIYTNNAFAARVNASGNIGIGTGTITDTSNYRNIHVEGTNGTIMRFMANGTQVGQIQSDTNEFQLNAVTDDPIVFKTNNTERMRITSGGLAIGGTGSANSLSDYEEGNASSLSVQTGTATFSKQRYIKIGKLVNVRFQVTSFSNRTGANNIVIQNLPFTSGSIANTVGTVLGRYTTAGDGPVIANVGDSSSELILYGMNDGGNWDQIEHQQLNNDAATFVINITYETA